MEGVWMGHGFRRRQLLGRGGFSRVYCVEESETGRYYACKVSGNRELLKREAEFLREAVHPLFPGFRDLWEEDETGYLVTDFVPGSSLESLLERRGRFSEAQVARIGMELAEGLLFLHERGGGLIFRDVKPANIMIRQDGRIKLLDIGCACRIGESRAGIAGTPGYAAPEQLEGSRGLTVRCDVYGLGMTLKIIAGGGRGRGRLSRVIAACTRQEPSRRLPDMRSVLGELSGCGRGKCRMPQTELSRSGILVQKNIWESSWKTP